LLSVLTDFDPQRSDLLGPNKKDTGMRSTKQAHCPSRSQVFGAAILLMSAVIVGSANGAPDEQQRTDPQATQTSKALSDADLDKLGMQKLAEMTAMSRHDETCPNVPDEWSAAFIILLTKNTPPEEQVEAQERKVLALRDKIGDARWCRLYAVEMQEAYIVVQSIMQRKSP
jgi:hypothetical protein